METFSTDFSDGEVTKEIQYVRPEKPTVWGDMLTLIALFVGTARRFFRRGPVFSTDFSDGQTTKPGV
jgi:hypothetical protein